MGHTLLRFLLKVRISANLNYVSVVSQNYATRVNDADVILGNSALLKCEIPSFVTDFVSVKSWTDDTGLEYFITNTNTGTFLKILCRHGAHKL